MKKRLSALLALLLCAALLCGCAGPEERSYRLTEGLVRLLGTGNQAESGDMLPFGQIEYVRPEGELEALQSQIDRLEELLEADAGLGELTEVLDACFDSYNHFMTQYTVAEIRSCQDMTDQFYENEYAWCEEYYYQLQALMDEMYFLCGGSKQAKKLEKEYFWEGFAAEYADSSSSAFSDEMEQLYQQEAKLLSRYRALLGSPTITVDGQEVDFYGYLMEADDEEYFDAWMNYYRSYNERFGELYIELVKVRSAEAKALGFDSFEEYAYRYSFERDYSPAEARAYLAGIREILVPLYLDLQERGALESDYLRGMSEQELEQVLQSAAESMGGDAEEAFRFLRDYELYDIRLSERKMDKSFQDYLNDYEAPYVFVKTKGDLSDVTTFAHEFGHALDAYVNYNAYESIDVAECFSQAMELLLIDRADGQLSDWEREALMRYKALDNLDMYVQQGSFAEFEELVYSVDPEELTVEMLNDFSLQTAKDYGYFEPGYEDYYALSWIDITHFFETPFYVISYPVSNDMAMQIYELERQEHGAGLEKYLQMLPRDYDGLLETLSAGGLDSPFAPGRLEAVAADLESQILGESAEQAA